MGFKLKLAGGRVGAGGTGIESNNGDWYEFLEGGVLAVHFEQAGRWSEYYPPEGWQQLTADQPPGPIPSVDVY